MQPVRIGDKRAVGPDHPHINLVAGGGFLPDAQLPLLFPRGDLKGILGVVKTVFGVGVLAS